MSKAKNYSDDHLPSHLRGDEDEPAGRSTVKDQPGIVFVDEKGRAVGLPFPCVVEAEKDALKCTFGTPTGTCVVRIEGYGLVAPIHKSLLMMLTLQKLNLVQATPGGKERDFGQKSDGWKATSISWEVVER